MIPCVPRLSYAVTLLLLLLSLYSASLRHRHPRTLWINYSAMDSSPHEHRTLSCRCYIHRNSIMYALNSLSHFQLASYCLNNIF
ncbi:uncharacterized protein LAESUDRAFT_703248 [Laetiporus sulphureus 93-53]|uniref:Secreted protein n=1 Tax=Laetiporus sulphureus 93-53 TaxID=1314785 RepID=A0A165DD82_9APHY|nr:uncharacterized protein LAESUDRAFT_703248 [Laetiporus sulphureus 93-53]KZT04613.1 hypothetical protein LAESUDRAFT_703248 [Laetiporus sulphureus 93-53]